MPSGHRQGLPGASLLHQQTPLWLEGGRETHSPLGPGTSGDQERSALTSASCSIHKGAVALIVEEEVGSVLVVTEDIRGAVAENGAHADTPAR